jgi:tetratricopeptide (TPR) repeat protein
LYDDIINQDPKDVDALVNKSDELLKLNKYAEALKVAQMAIMVSPKDKDAWFNKGEAQMKMGEHLEALVSFKKSLKIEPKDEESWYMMAKCLLHIGKQKEAMKPLLIATSIAPAFKVKAHKDPDFRKLYKLSRSKDLVDL